MINNKLKDKDKLIIIFYINVYGLSNDYKRTEFLLQINKELKRAFDDSVKYLILPINKIDEPDYKVDCINPKFYDDNCYKELISKLEDIYNDYINKNIDNKK